MKSTSFKLNQGQKKSRKKLFIFIAIAVLILGGLASVLYLRRQSDNKPMVTDDSAQTGSAKKDAIENDKPENKTGNLPADSNNLTTDQVPTSSETKIASLDFNQTGDTITVSASISGANATGTCVFSFKSPDEKPVVKQTESSTEQCMTSVSKYEFSKLGSWNLSVVRYQGDTKAEAAREVSIN